MGESIVQLPPDSTGRKLRTRQRVIGANTIEEQYFIEASERVVTAEVLATSFRTLGAAATTHTVFGIENGAASGLIVGVRRLSIQVDATVALTVVAPSVKTSRISGTIAGGTALSKVTMDSNDSSAALVRAVGATASDGGGATAISTGVGTSFWTQLTMRHHTLVGQALMDDAACIPVLSDTTPVFIRPGQSLLVQIVAAAASSNPATNHWILNAMWEEFTLP